MTRSEFIELFTTLTDAVDFEARVLSIDDDFLPPHALAVKRGEINEPGSDYWNWLASQIEEVV